MTEQSVKCENLIDNFRFADSKERFALSEYEWSCLVWLLLMYLY